MPLAAALGAGLLLLALAVVPRQVEASPAVRFEVDLSERKLMVHLKNGKVLEHTVAVGMKGYSTPKGHFAISQVEWNPDWHPPKEKWAEGKKPKAPGEKGNPLGRAKLLFKRPDWAIHGTIDPSSLGKRVSHGCIRVSNSAVLDLARLVMDSSGAGKSSSWYTTVRKNRSTQRIVNLPNPVPIHIHD